MGKEHDGDQPTAGLAGAVLGSLPEQFNSGGGTPYRPAMARQSRGYGFVRFGDESDQQRALLEMQGVYCGNRPMRISTATPKPW